MTMTEDEARTALVAAGARLGARGLVVATEGNLSVRLDAGILITPSGRRKDALSPADPILVAFEPDTDAGNPGPAGISGLAGVPGLAGGPAASRPSSDLAIHRAIYRSRPDVAAIVHAHLAAAMALTLVGEYPDPNTLPETALFLPRLPFVSYAHPGSDLLAAKIAGALTDGGAPGDYPNAALLERHGAIAVGPDLAVAADRLELADLLCRVHRDAILLRSARGNGG